uniref:Uncharacterized protein n=1 Tax=Avena sativa TaxID=4498 RepID=A0ACD5TPN8_AVESA
MIKDSSSYNDKCRSKSEELLEELPEEHDYGIEETKMVKLGKRRRQCNEDDDVISGDDPNIVGVDVLTTQTTIVQQTILLPVLPEEYDNGTGETKTVKPMKRRRRYICNEDDTSGDDQNIVGVEGGANMLTTQTAIMEQYGSLPVDEPSWSGMLKIGSKGLVSLEAHLLAKSCEKVWECSRYLENVVQVTKLSRLEAEPKSFKVSKPTEDNIGLYFFPQGMRPNEEFDKLVQEVMVNDLILRAYVNEAEMLILPSILLPERHQTFQGKHYLWGLFKRREDQVNVEGGKQMHGTHLSGHEKENGKQLCSRPSVGKQDIDKEENAFARPAERAAAEAATPAPAAGAATSPALSLPAERAAAGVVTPAPAATSSNGTSSPHPAERAAAEATTPAPAATTATSHAPISAVSPGGMYGFIVRPNPRIQQLIQEMEREGAVVFTMRGEAIGYGRAGQ